MTAANLGSCNFFPLFPLFFSTFALAPICPCIGIPRIGVWRSKLAKSDSEQSRFSISPPSAGGSEEATMNAIDVTLYLCYFSNYN